MRIYIADWVDKLNWRPRGRSERGFYANFKFIPESVSRMEANRKRARCTATDGRNLQRKWKI